MSQPRPPVDFHMLENYAELAGMTAVYPFRSNNLEYPSLGLTGECGELLLKLSQGVFDEEGAPNLIADEIRDELGDILWYIAACCFELQLEFDDLFEDVAAKGIEADELVFGPFGMTSEGILYASCVKMTGYAGKFADQAKKSIRDDAGKVTGGRRAAMRPLLVDLGRFWCAACYPIGLLPEEVARRNTQKLRDRQARSTIHGDGDHR